MRGLVVGGGFAYRADLLARGLADLYTRVSRQELLHLPNELSAIILPTRNST
jgi:hypothetical protein